MPKPAELMNKFYYDPKEMSGYLCLLEYLKTQDYEVTSIIKRPPQYCKTENVISKNKIKYHLPIVIHLEDFDAIIKNSKEFSDDHICVSPEKRSDMLINISSKMKSYYEYLLGAEFIRGHPRSDVLKYDISTIEQALAHYSHMCYANKCTPSLKVVIFKEEYSLSKVAKEVIGFLSMGAYVSILATEEVAVTAYVFVKALLDSRIPAGLINLHLVSKKAITENTFEEKLPKYGSKCSVVVTESSDLDSCVDFLSYETTREDVYDWKIDYIFVQESIYSEFEQRLGSRFKKEPQNVSVVPLGCIWWYSKYSKSIFILSGNVNLDNRRYKAIMQTYRTTKELMSLLKNKRPYAVSLWCDSVSVSNEISQVDASVVWINSYAKFSEEDYDFGMRSTMLIKKTGEIPEKLSSDDDGKIKAALKSLEIKLEKWNKLNHAERVTLLLNESNKCLRDHNGSKESVETLIREISSKQAQNAIVSSKDSFVRITKSQPLGLAFIECNAIKERELSQVVEMALAIVDGNAIILNCADISTYWNSPFLTNILAIDNIPIVSCDISAINPFAVAKYSAIQMARFSEEPFRHEELRTKKSIWYPSVETFAN